MKEAFYKTEEFRLLSDRFFNDMKYGTSFKFTKYEPIVLSVFIQFFNKRICASKTKTKSIINRYIKELKKENNPIKFPVHLTIKNGMCIRLEIRERRYYQYSISTYWNFWRPATEITKAVNKSFAYDKENPRFKPPKKLLRINNSHHVTFSTNPPDVLN